MKLLSIIIATYNAGNTLDACLTSITKQKSSEIELLIIDGGSSDKTLDIIHSYGDKIDVLISEPDKGIYDAFVIVPSDSDYTPLAINLHESGVYVMGVGEKKTPEAFRNSCDEFIFLENLGENIKAAKSKTESSEKAIEIEEECLETATVDSTKEDISVIHNLLKIASDKYQDDEGYVNVSSAGQFIKRVKPDFDVRTFGFIKLPKLIEAFPRKYEIKKYPGKGKVTIIAYRCK